MKHHFKYIISFCAVLLASSCGKDFLDITPVDRLTADNFYRNETEIKASTASLYGFPWYEFNDKFFWCAGDEMSGNIYHTWDQEGQFFYFSFTEGNAHISSGWKGLFRVISYANSIINDMPAAAAGKASELAINRALGEARFIRGTAYYMLAEFWGDVPIVENSTELVAANNLILPKNTRASVYEFIRRDLAFAAENLPVSDNPGRATQWSAKGMLAKLHLTLAQNLSDAKSAENFAKAKALAAEVIETSGLSLLNNYADLFKIANNNNSESLFAMQWMEGSYGLGNSRQANWARSSVITGNSEAWGGGKGVTYDFIQDVEPGDKRQTSIYMKPGDFYPEISKDNGGYTFKLVNRDPSDPNIALENAPPVLNSLKKYIVGSAEDNAGKVSTGQAVALNQYVLRLADVYLIYAEATLGAAPSTADAKALQYFNAIRTRAGLASKTSLTFADILKERRIEFGLESITWFDIKRFFYRDAPACLAYLSAQEKETTFYRINTPNAPDENTVAGYQINPPPSLIKVDAAKMFLPIPAAEVVANAKLAPGVAAEEYKFK